MARDKRNLKELSDEELNELRQEVIAEEIRRIEQASNSSIVSAVASIEEDLKVLDVILAKTNLK
ncbi:MAG: hypothetical protein ACRC2R_17805 [Xenococcaceae cyanobacterium]